MERQSHCVKFSNIGEAYSAPEVDYPRPPSRNKTQKGSELRRAITGISIMGLGMFWFGLAEALENNNISIGQFLLSTLLLAVIGCSIGMIFVGAQTGFERR